MRTVLQYAAWLIVLVVVGAWLATGANRGWTKTSVPVRTLDDVTGIEGITYEKRFQPGVDVLGAAFGGAALLAGASWFFRKPGNHRNPQPRPPTHS